MSKKQLVIGSIILAVSFISIPVIAADYSSMSTKELAQLRGTLRDAGDEERQAFRSEWRKRIRKMTREEAAQYRGRPENALAEGNGYKYNARNSHRAGHKVRHGNRVCDETGNRIRETQRNRNRGQ